MPIAQKLLHSLGGTETVSSLCSKVKAAVMIIENLRKGQRGELWRKRTQKGGDAHETSGSPFFFVEMFMYNFAPGVWSL